jgi:hypothetical protein
MNEEVLLTLHCPECRRLVEVVGVGDELVCLECGWKFDEKVVAKFLGRKDSPAVPIAPCAPACSNSAN